jgi:DNA-binding CsgD family transcriptional regulator/tetratricopeptide (TPR) repeat protein
MSQLGALQCPIIVGRDDLLDLADRRLAEVATGRGQLLLLAGDAGVGKTRLLDAIRRKARANGFAQANGALAPQDQSVPSALIGDLARSIRGNPAFGTLGDDLLSLAADHSGDALAARRIYVLDVVDRIAAIVDESHPVMLDFEDIQWADEISLEIVGELARRGRELPLFLVGAYRTEDLPPGSFFREWRSRLIGQRLAEEARLQPLTAEQTALMTTLILDTGLPAPREVVAAVYERTDGFPLHIEELLGALPESARTDGRKILDANVPDTIEDAILVRIAQLSPEAREVGRAGAVIGRCFNTEVLAGVMDRPVGELDGPIAELIERSYLYDAGDVGFIDFRHQLLRDVLYRSVPATELRKLHARAAEFGPALAGQSEIHSSVHFERAGMHTQAFRAALTGAEAAGRMSGRQESFDLYRRAIANMPADLPVLEQADLYAAFAGAASAIERMEDFREASLQARERFLRADRPGRATMMLLNIANADRRNGRSLDDRRQLVSQALAEIEQLAPGPEQDAALADVMVFKTLNAMDAVDLDTAIASAARYRELAADLGDPELSLDADFYVEMIDVIAGRAEPGIGRLVRIAREARDAGFESTGVTSYRVAANLAVRIMDYPAAEAAIREGLRYADAIEQSHCRQQMAATSAFLAWTGGRWDDASQIARQELVERGCRRGVTGAIDVIGLVAMSRGRIDEARRWLNESLDSGIAADDVELTMGPLWGLAEVDVLAGDPAAASKRCEEALALAVRSGERALLVPFVVTGIRAALAARRPQDAERWLDRVRAHFAELPAARPAIRHADGLVRLSQGSITAARDALEAAVHGWTEIGRIWESSWARLDLAQCLMRSNRYGEAASLLAAVRTTAEQVDSPPLIARLDELARIGRGRGEVNEPWWPLTAREFEVARLIAEGLTNGEIAERLDIAPKTASSHVEHILAKLGVTRRAEIAAWTAAVGRPLVAADDRRDREGAVAVRSR